MTGTMNWLSVQAGSDWAPWAIDSVAKATVLLLVAWAVAVLLRRASAAVRHRVWTLSFVGLLLLPVLSPLLPNWRLSIVQHPHEYTGQRRA